MSRPAYLREVCWSEDDVLCLQNTASAPSEDDDPHRGKHVFDAIHTPPPLFHHANVRRFVADAGGSLSPSSAGERAATDQQRLLDAIDEGYNAGRNLLFVAGATGAGKSHMVRWLHAQYSERNPSALSIHVRRRDTDLVTVVRRLASAFGHQGAALSKLVEDAEVAGVATTSAFLNTTLVSALSAYAREVAEHSISYSSRALTPEQAALRQAAGMAEAEPEAQPGHLDLVSDASRIELTQHWAELVRTQPAEAALEEGLLSKMREADPEKRQVLGDDLLPLTTLPDEQLAPRLLPLRDQLADPSIRDWIAEVLLGPKAMDFAVQASGASIQAEQLQNALRDALEGAAAQGVRVVFFFEDWGSVTGVRSGLLEAFTSMDDTHTAVIADTTRELRKLQDNVADRSIAVFEIGAVSEPFALRLAGRALNAVRVGGPNLHRSSKAGEPLTNRCTDCEFIRDCHQTFGAVEDDELGPVGLFPLTSAVIQRALARDGMERTPRAMIMGILRKAIEHSHGAFDRSEYPTAEIATALAPVDRPVDDPDDLSEIESVVGSDRRPTSANVLHLYRDQRALRSLPQELAEAFELNEFSSDAMAPKACRRCGQLPCSCPPVEDDTEGVRETNDNESKVSRTIPELARDAEHFGRGEALRLSNSLRDAMFEFSIAGVGFGNGIATRASMTKLGRLTESNFGLEGTRGTHVASATRDDAPSLRALAWALKSTPTGSWREQDNGHRRRATALNRVAAWTQAFDEELRNPAARQQRASLLVPYLAALNAIVAPRSVIDGPTALLNLALAEARPERHQALTVSLQNALDDRALARQELLADLSLVQGETGKVFGIDATIIYQDLHVQYDTGLRLPQPDELPKPLRRWAHSVSRAVSDARTELRQTLEGITSDPEPVPDEQLDDLQTAVRAIRRAAADLPGRIATAELTALQTLEETLEKAAQAPKLFDFEPPGDVAQLRPLRLPAVLQDARDFRAALQPRAAVTSRTRKVIDLLGQTHDSMRTQGRLRVDELLEELQQRTGDIWPVTSTRSLGASPVGTEPTETLVDELRALEQELRSAGQQIELDQRINAATDRAEQLLRLLDQDMTLQQQAKTLGIEPAPTARPPAPGRADSIEHLRSGAMTEWIDTTQQQQADQRTAIQVRWEQLKREYKPANHWQIARLLDDQTAEKAFDEAERLHAGLGTEVPPDAQERLDAVQKAEQQAWDSLRSRRAGPALDLAVRIQEHNGWLALSELKDSEIVPLLGPDGDQTLRFEVRLLED